MPLLATKLRAPTARRLLVARARLVDQLRGQSPMPRLVLVSAPAGFGKTTLLTQWLTSQDTGDGRGTLAARVAWLSLDPADSDPRMFLPHLVAALQIVSPEVGVEALTLMDTAREFPRDIASHRAWRIRRPAVRRARRSRAAMAGRQ